jgi:hypothetical protein
VGSAPAPVEWVSRPNSPHTEHPGHAAGESTSLRHQIRRARRDRVERPAFLVHDRPGPTIFSSVDRKWGVNFQRSTGDDWYPVSCSSRGMTTEERAGQVERRRENTSR